MERDLELKKRIKNLFFIAISVVSILVAYSFIYIYAPKFTLKCVFYELTSLKCPGCGITRMMASFIRLKFIEGIKYNMFLGVTFPFVLWIFVYSGYLYVLDKKNGKAFNVSCFIYALLLLIWGIIRNIVGI